ncbi:MAG: polysaccharide deacetylase family protein [Actinomycetota bacterium]|jgi:peptidoglycan/xylan/chitin deacetylase (PgdA/CDA1 family)|nr:polysaccharide deacetylase family protein [Actinomycetota bacterium]
MKESIFSLARATGIPWLVRSTLQRKRVTIVLYHDIEPSLLDRHLAALSTRYSFISLDEYLDARSAGDASKLPDRALIVTLDDGRARNADLTQVFRAHGVVPTIFLCSAVVGTGRRIWCVDPVQGADLEALKLLPDAERVARLADLDFSEMTESDETTTLTREDIASMESSVDFESHTRFHPMLPRCDDARAQDEIEGAKKELEDGLGLNIRALSYPNGDYSDRDIQLAREAGYECAITVDLGFNDLGTDPFRLKRICLNDTGGVNETIVKASGLYSWLKNLMIEQPYGFVPEDQVIHGVESKATVEGVLS